MSDKQVTGFCIFGAIALTLTVFTGFAVRGDLKSGNVDGAEIIQMMPITTFMGLPK